MELKEGEEHRGMIEARQVKGKRISWVRIMEKRAGDAAGLNKEATRLVRFGS